MNLVLRRRAVERDRGRKVQLQLRPIRMDDRDEKGSILVSFRLCGTGVEGVVVLRRSSVNAKSLGWRVRTQARRKGLDDAERLVVNLKLRSWGKQAPVSDASEDGNAVK